MSNPIIYAVYFMGLFGLLGAQTLRFVKQYNFGFTDGGYVSTNVLKKNNGFLLCGYGVNSTQNLNSSLSVINTDSIGQQLWQKYTNAPGNFRYSNNSSSSSFQELKDGHILFTGEIDYGSSYSKSCLVKLSKNNGDTMWVKQYSQVGDTSNLFCTSQLTDSSFLSIGYKYFDSGTQFFNRPFILKTDKSGNYKWHKFLWNMSALFFPSFNKLISLNDKDFIVSGVFSYTSPGTRGFLIKLDTLGNIIYNQTFSINTYTLNGFTDALILNDGNFLLSGQVTTFHTSNFSVEKTRPCLVKVLSSNGSVISSKLYASEKDYGHSIGDLYQDPISLNIYATGMEFFSPSTFKATFYKFNSLLDSLFMRYYDFGLGGTLGATSSVRSNDGGFGYAMQLYPATGQQMFCLMKTDTMGCDSAAGCFNSIGFDDVVASNVHLKVYPVPFDSDLKISVETILNKDELKVQIISTLGVVVKEQKISPSASINTINTKDLSSGIYILQLFSGAKPLSNRRIIKD